jgi:plastocyanin
MKETGKITVIAIISIVAMALALTTILIPVISASHGESSYLGVKREFWLFNSGIPEFNDTMMGMPHDVYSVQTITVKQGDTVVIHFFNKEPQSGDHHSFTILDQPYKMDIEVNPGENKTITFNANVAGTFTYICTFHQPTMRGQLVVEST